MQEPRKVLLMEKPRDSGNVEIPGRPVWGAGEGEGLEEQVTEDPKGSTA